MEDPYLQHIQKIPSIFEGIIDTIGVLYPCIDDFEEAFEFYNAVKIIISKINLSATEAVLNRDASEDNCAASFITVPSDGAVMSGNKGKIAKYIRAYPMKNA